MTVKLILALGLNILLTGAPAFSQTFPSQPKNELTQSFGVFRILVIRKFADHFKGCKYYDEATRKFTSPVLYDPATEIGLSAALEEGHPVPAAGVPVGDPPRSVGDQDLILPPEIAEPPKNNREVHTEIRSLKMVNNEGYTVRAGRYISATQDSPPADQWRSRGEVFSDAKPGEIGDSKHDFPARSFFNVFVNIDIPHCGKLPPTTIYNKLPLKVWADRLQGLPPTVIYEHDASSAVPVYVRENLPVAAGGRIFWKHEDELVGYLLLAGHGVGQGANTKANEEKFLQQVLRQHEAQPPCECP
jgi:hypothetical protein